MEPIDVGVLAEHALRNVRYCEAAVPVETASTAMAPLVLGSPSQVAGDLRDLAERLLRSAPDQRAGGHDGSLRVSAEAAGPAALRVVLTYGRRLEELQLPLLGACPL
jgi:hypothetical protein